MVYLYDNDDYVATTTANAVGQWAIETSLVEGNHVLASNACSDVVCTSSTDLSDPVAITVNVGPSQINPPSITNPGTITTPSFVVSGTAVPGVHVALYQSESDGNLVILHPLGSVAADSQGQWSIRVTALYFDGPYSVVARSCDDTGCSVNSDTVDFNVDASPMITSPAPEAVLSSFTFTVSGISAPGLTIQVGAYSDTGGESLGTVTSGQDGQWSIQVTDHDSSTSQYIYAYACDDLSCSDADTIHVTLSDTVPLVVFSTGPVNGATGVSPSYIPSAIFSEPIDASTLDGSSFFVENDCCTVHIDGGVGLSQNGRVAVFYPNTPLAPGAYTVTMLDTITDLEGNHLTGTDGQGRYQWHFEVSDTQAPDTTIDSAIDGNNNVVAANAMTGSNTITFTFTSPATDIDHFVCTIDGITYANVANSNNCSSPALVPDLSDGAHTFTVAAVDTSGNTDQTPASFTWTVDQTAPTVALNTATDGNGVVLPIW